MILTISSFIIASEFPTCSDEEKDSLMEAETAVDEGLAIIEVNLEVALVTFEGCLLTLKIKNFNTFSHYRSNW